jgi:hypothetical protein
LDVALAVHAGRRITETESDAHTGLGAHFRRLIGTQVDRRRRGRTRILHRRRRRRGAGVGVDGRHARVFLFHRRFFTTRAEADITDPASEHTFEAQPEGVTLPACLVARLVANLPFFTLRRRSGSRILHCGRRGGGVGGDGRIVDDGRYAVFLDAATGGEDEGENEGERNLLLVHEILQSSPATAGKE